MSNSYAVSATPIADLPIDRPFVTTFEQDDLYKFNQLIHKLDDAGYEAAATAMREVRDAHFDDMGTPDTLNHNA